MASYTEVNIKPWRKILYEKQNYPDNYLDENQFKKDLKNNLYLKPLKLCDALMFTGSIIQEILNVFIFISMFLYLEENANITLIINLLGFSSIVAIVTACNTSPNTVQLIEWFKQSLLFLLFLCGTTPILNTLTQSISTDTLWCLTIIMLCSHLLFHRYSNYSTGGALVSDAFSLNAAIFGAVCLSSRLNTSLDSFILILTAVLLFVFIPKIRNQYFIHMSYIQVTVIIFIQWIIVSLSLPLSIGLLLSLIVITCLCSACLYVKLQYLKNTIHGPWDEATIDLNTL